MLKTFKSCWPVDNDGLHTSKCVTVVLQKLPAGHDGGVRNTTALSVSRSQTVRLSLTDVLLILIGPSRHALTMPAESRPKLNSMFVCRHVAPEYFHLFCLSSCLFFFLRGYIQTASCEMRVNIHWAPCCFDVPE